MPDNAIYNSSLTWDSPLFDDEPVIHPPVAVFEETVQHWAERELSMGTDEANIIKAAHALLYGGSVIDLAGLNLTSLPDVTLPSGVLRLDLSNNPQLTALPARFLDQSPFIYIVIDYTPLSGETIRFFEARLGSILFHYEQHPTGVSEPHGCSFYPEQLFTDVGINPLKDTPPDGTLNPSVMEQNLLLPEHRAWLKTNVDDRVSGGIVKAKRLATLLEGAEPLPKGLTQANVASHYGFNTHILYSALGEVRRAKVSVRRLSAVHRRWLARHLGEPVASVKMLATLCLAHRPYPAGLTELLIARYYNVKRTTLHNAIARISPPEVVPPLSETMRAWLALHWDDKVPEGEGKMDAVVALYLAHIPLPTGLTCAQIAVHYRLKFSTFESSIQRCRTQEPQPPQSDILLTWLEQHWDPQMADIKSKGGKTKALAALFVSDNARPEDLTRMQIAGYYKLTYNALTKAILRAKKTQVPQRLRIENAGVHNREN
ncbi:hypothetical protein [unidentified bacterial endosymbiont]|uniref:hypothetical protein n=1 Tax=unidentified bacterial endosymbiont TaxID=2355 RepID=UPI00209EBFAE|nr:hypothetical protein [unidentified bacterial endosymbiont]